MVGVTADRDRGTWIALGISSALGLIAAWVLGAIFIARPVSRAFDIEHEARLRLEELDHMRADFMALVSHDLRNPMATIRGFGQMLRDQPDLLDDTEREKAYEVIVRQVDRMASLVDNVLDASRIETDAFAYAFIPYRASDLLAEAVTEARAMWPDHPITLGANEVPGDAKGDRDRLQQVIANLLSNACRYSDPGVEVTVEARADGGDLVVDVIDRGVGIDPAEQPRVFERFARGRTPGLDGVSGAGLGLYISRRIVEAHGGRLSVDSAPGRGSTFTMRVPLDPRAR
ncbi:MAG: HAMP domain-containing sensor histidine kinase [Actinomycetota bacterium]